MSIAGDWVFACYSVALSGTLELCVVSGGKTEAYPALKIDIMIGGRSGCWRHGRFSFFGVNLTSSVDFDLCDSLQFILAALAALWRVDRN